MSHPIRVRILGILERRAASPVEIARVVDASLGTVAYHMRTLADLGLVQLDRETRRRGAVEHHYRAAPRPRATSAGWSGASPIGKQAAIGSGLQMSDEMARRSAGAGGFDREDAALTRLSLRLDAKAFAQLSKAIEQLAAKAEKLEADATARLEKAGDDAEVIQAQAAFMLFERVVDDVELAASKP